MAQSLANHYFFGPGLDRKKQKPDDQSYKGCVKISHPFKAFKNPAKNLLTGVICGPNSPNFTSDVFNI